MSAPVEVIAHPSPIYFLGDSHCIAFNNLLVREPSNGHEYLTIAKYIPNLNGDRIIQNDSINAHLLWALQAESLIVPRGEGWIPRHVLEGTQDPTLVFFAGEIDVRGMAEKLGPETDFVLPFPLPDADRFASTPHPRIAPFSIIENAVNTKVWNICSALHRLTQAGFRKVFLHSIAPDSSGAPSIVRYRLTCFFHLLLASNAANIGVQFLNLWDQFTHHNQLRPEYYLDGIHLNKHATIATMRKLFAHLGRSSPELVSRLQPVYYMGDSRVEHFHRIVYQRADARERFVVRGHHIPELRLATALEGPGATNQPLMRAMFSDMLTVFDFESRQFFAAHRPSTPAGESLVKATLGSRRDPLLVFFVGDDELEAIASYDDPSSEALARVGVFLAALDGLRQTGFRSIAVVPIPTREGDPLLRRGLVQTINAALEKQCGAAGVHYLAATSEIDPRGLMAAADEVRTARGRETLFEVYELSHIMARQTSERNGATFARASSEQWERAGELAIGSLPPFAAAFDFKAQRDIERPDWVDDALARELREAQWARPSFAELQQLFALIYCGTARAAITSALQCNYVAVGVRPFRVPLRGLRTIQIEDLPAGVVHATLSRGGMLTLRDRARFEAWLRALEPGSEHLDVVLMPEDPYAGRYVSHAGLAAWPVDPVNLSLEGVTLVRAD